ncbi:Secondary metabolism regulator lae1 [Alternaria sp. BMP 2799]|nr:Secondary metabolism regulator lae1 [Alternaria sp. BMP 2799]
MENGRWYHGFRRGLYMYPCDEPENDRMDIYHQFFAVARRGQLHQSPHANVKLPEAPQTNKKRKAEKEPEVSTVLVF